MILSRLFEIIREKEGLVESIGKHLSFVIIAANERIFSLHWNHCEVHTLRSQAYETEKYTIQLSR